MTEDMTPAEVRAARQRLAMTHAQLSQALPVNPSTGRPIQPDSIRSWERGRDKPRQMWQDAIADLLAEVEVAARAAAEGDIFTAAKGDPRGLAVGMRAQQLNPDLRLDWTN